MLESDLMIIWLTPLSPRIWNVLSQNVRAEKSYQKIKNILQHELKLDVT